MTRTWRSRSCRRASLPWRSTCPVAQLCSRNSARTRRAMHDPKRSAGTDPLSVCRILHMTGASPDRVSLLKLKGHITHLRHFGISNLITWDRFGETLLALTASFYLCYLLKVQQGQSMLIALKARSPNLAMMFSSAIQINILAQYPIFWKIFSALFQRWETRKSLCFVKRLDLIHSTRRFQLKFNEILTHSY